LHESTVQGSSSLQFFGMKAQAWVISSQESMVHGLPSLHVRQTDWQVPPLHESVVHPVLSSQSEAFKQL
jgi:hypothetical protein